MAVLTPVKTTQKQAFINALRSGEFKQCQYLMYNDEGEHCAMGVFHAINNDPKVLDISISQQFASKVFHMIALLNDTGTTFSELADILEVALSEDLQSFSY